MATKNIIAYNPNEKDKSEILSHIYYEIWQLYGSITLLNIRVEDSPEKEQNLNNAILESSLVHARVLCNFFEKEKRQIRNGKELDDVLSTDFSFQATTLPIDQIYRERLNKDIAHLSYSRNKRRTGVDKEWRYEKIFLPILETSVQFIESLSIKTIESCEKCTPKDWEALRKNIIRMCDLIKPHHNPKFTPDHTR